MTVLLVGAVGAVIGALLALGVWFLIPSHALASPLRIIDYELMPLVIGQPIEINIKVINAGRAALRVDGLYRIEVVEQVPPDSQQRRIMSSSCRLKKSEGALRQFNSAPSQSRSTVGDHKRDSVGECSADLNSQCVAALCPVGKCPRFTEAAIGIGFAPVGDLPSVTIGGSQQPYRRARRGIAQP